MYVEQRLSTHSPYGVTDDVHVHTIFRVQRAREKAERGRRLVGMLKDFVDSEFFRRFDDPSCVISMESNEFSYFLYIFSED